MRLSSVLTLGLTPNLLPRSLTFAALVVGLTLTPLSARAQLAPSPSGIFNAQRNCINYKTTLPSVRGSNFVVYSPPSAAGVARTVAGIIRTKNVIGVYESGLRIPSLLQPGQPAPFPIFVDPSLLQETGGAADGETARLCQHITWAALAIQGTLKGDTLAGVIYHELFHVAQFALLKSPPVFDNWWFEATATAAEPWFGSQDPVKYVPSLTSNPNLPIDKLGMNHEYGAFLFVQWIMESASMPSAKGWAFLRASIGSVASHKPAWNDGLNDALATLPTSAPCPSPETLLACQVASFWADETNTSPRFGPPAKLTSREIIDQPSQTIQDSPAPQLGAEIISLAPASEENKMEVMISSVPAGVEVWVNLGSGQLKRLAPGQDFDETFCRGGQQAEGTYPLPKTGDVRLAMTTTDTGAPPHFEFKVLASTTKCQRPGITMFQHSVNGGTTPAAVFQSASCKRPATGKVGTFQAKAKSGSYTLQVKIDAFDGFKTYPLRYEVSNPSFAVNGPGGPFSNIYWPGGTPPSQGGSITFSTDGSVMGLGFIDAFDSSFSDDIVIAGTLSCNYSNH